MNNEHNNDTKQENSYILQYLLHSKAVNEIDSTLLTHRAIIFHWLVYWKQMSLL